jgi:hypothetical protein
MSWRAMPTPADTASERPAAGPLTCRSTGIRIGVAAPLRAGASVGLHEAHDFRLIGVHSRVGFKLGAWHDVGWWQLTLQRSDGAPPEARRLGELIDTPEWPALLEGRTLAGS